MCEIGGEVFSHSANLAEIECKSGPNDRKEWRYGIVSLIHSRGHLLAAYWVATLGDLRQGVREIGGEVSLQGLKHAIFERN